MTLLILAVTFTAALSEYAISAAANEPFFTDLRGGYAPNTSAFSLIWVTFASAAAFFAAAPLKIGVAGWYLSLAGAEKETDIFALYASKRRIMSALRLRAAIFMRYIFWGTVFLIVPTVFFFLTLQLRKSGDADTFFVGALISNAAVALLSLILCVWFCQRYFLAEYILARSPEAAVRYALKRSAFAMRGRCGELFALKIRLLAYKMTEAAVIPAFYTMPIRMTALANFADERLGSLEEKANRAARHTF